MAMQDFFDLKKAKQDVRDSSRIKDGKYQPKRSANVSVQGVTNDSAASQSAAKGMGAKSGSGGNMQKMMAAGQMLKGVMGSGGSEGGAQSDSDGAMGGAMSGASAGAAFGPWGAAVGAVAGAVMGSAKARAARKAHNAQVEAKKLAAVGEIEQERGRQMSAAIGQMGSRMSIR